MTARRFGAAQRNALRWPQVSAALRMVQDPRHGVQGGATLNWAYNFRGEALRDVAAGGGYRLHLVVDATAPHPAQWEWRGSVICGESKQPLMDALHYRHLDATTRKGAVRLLRAALAEVGIAASEVWDDGARRPGQGQGLSPMHLTCRKSLTPEERRTVGRHVQAQRGAWRAVQAQDSWGERQAEALARRLDQARVHWRSEWVKAGRILADLFGRRVTR